MDAVPMPRRALGPTIAVVALVLALSVVQQALDDPVAAGAAAVGAGTLVALALLWRARRDGVPRSPLTGLAVSLLLVASGDAVFVWFDARGREPFPSVADLLYLLAYPPLAWAVLRLRAPDRPRLPALLDGAALAAAGVLPVWVLLVEPVLGSGDALAGAVGAAYPLGDLVVAVLLLEAVSDGRGRSRAEAVALLGLLGLVVSDVCFAVAAAGGWYESGSWVDLGWQVQRACFLLLAVGPWQLRQRPAHGPGEDARALVRRVAALALLTAAGPLALVLHPEGLHPLDVVVLAGATFVLTSCVLLRLLLVARALGLLLEAQQRESARARSVADAGARLLSAVGRTEAQRTCVQAAVDLVAPGDRHAGAALALGSVHLLELVATHAQGLAPAAGGLDLTTLSGADRSALAEGREVWHEVTGPEGGRDALVVLPLPDRGVPGVLLVAAPVDLLEAAVPALRTWLLHVAQALAAVGTREREHREQLVTRARPLLPRQAGPGAADLVRALRGGELVPYFQPIVDLVQGGVEGFEALVRWEHPQHGLLLPGAFLPQVEAAGLQGQLDLSVLAAAAAAAVSWSPGPQGPYVSVNVSAARLLDPGFVAEVRGVLLRSGLVPWRLLLEVTESGVLQRAGEAGQVLGRLRALRVRVAFDDFGTGYSSLSWLQQLPLDVVKIDKSFVDRLPVRDGGTSVVEAVVRLAQTLGLHVVAEGVETQEQADALRAMGVSSAQGWLFSRAVPPHDVPALLPPRPRRPLLPDLPARWAQDQSR